MPVVPRSLGMWYSLFGSHAWLRTAGIDVLEVGDPAVVELLDVALFGHLRHELRRGAREVVPGRAGRELGQQLVVVGERVVDEVLDAELGLERLHVGRCDVVGPVVHEQFFFDIPGRWEAAAPRRTAPHPRAPRRTALRCCWSRSVYRRRARRCRRATRPRPGSSGAGRGSWPSWPSVHRDLRLPRACSSSAPRPGWPRRLLSAIPPGRDRPPGATGRRPRRPDLPPGRSQRPCCSGGGRSVRPPSRC